MLKRLKKNFLRGIDRLKWFSVVFSERLRIEIAIIKFLFESDELDKERDEVFRTIGRRVYELKDHGERNISRDKIVAEAICSIEKIESNIEELNKKVSDLSSVRA